jgi:hypothetical protein
MKPMRSSYAILPITIVFAILAWIVSLNLAHAQNSGYGGQPPVYVIPDTRGYNPNYNSNDAYDAYHYQNRPGCDRLNSSGC